jgi:hypothetical protein
VSLCRLPLLPAFLEEGGWDIFRILVFAAEVAEDDEHNEEGTYGD